jgi:outer membrane lipoprotein-sorting protein
LKEDVPMLRKALIGLLAAAASALAPATAQTLDEVIAKHLEARGGVDKIKAVQSMKMTGKMTVGPGIEAPVTLEMKRPANVRLEIVFQGNTGVQAYDGKTGWGISPMAAKKDPEPMSADELKEMEEQADMDGSLVDWKAKGHSVELMGKEKVEGSDAYKLKLTLKNGDLRYVFIDADSFLELKTEARRTIRGTEMETESVSSDYKEVGGLVLPHTITNGAKGSPQKQTITVDKIELNVPIDDSRFKMPEVKKP